ncbi:TPM domain-containing protein [Floricoccus penangensis]|uniref:TPM domain-containing protein n=1 Tax=Floricoccus penangensis TaxID=1859475 RepID=UPI0020410E3F|nr:TPM domain-containing protein [Floricoccus penangensis]URZ86669.1 TPM domain-containing protein [Floricoccus penangensis]
MTSTKDFEKFGKKLNKAANPKYGLKKFNNFEGKLVRNEKYYSIFRIIFSILTVLSISYLVFIAPRKINNIQNRINIIEKEKKDILNNPPHQDRADNMKEYVLEEKNNTPLKIDGDNYINIDSNNIFVSDNANIIDSDTRSKIYDMNKYLARYTDGAQYMVVTINRLPENETIESYANKIFRKVGIGDSKLDNGVLYLISIDDRKFRLEVGYGMEGVLNDGKAGRIINADDIVDDFKDKHYSKAILSVSKTVTEIMNIKVNNLNEQIDQLNAQITYRVLIPIIIILISVIGIFILSYLIKQNRLVANELGIMYTNYSKTSSLNRTKTDFYYLLLSGIGTITSLKALHDNIGYGKIIEKNPNAKIVSNGVLVGNRLYGGDGYIMTNDYSSSTYNPANHSGGDSFGGGSSGGGGASGGW